MHIFSCRIDIRETIIDIPRQAVVTREGLNISVDGVVFYKVFDATRALLAIKNVKHSINLLAQTKLREVLALFTYEQIQLERKSLASTLKKILDVATDQWGVEVTRVELTDLTLPAALAQAMGAEAEARRRAQAGLIQAQGLAEVNLINAQNAQKTNLIHAETTAKAKEIEANALAAAKLIEAAGEEKAAEGFKNAAEIMNQAPGTMQLRFLQTLGRVGAGAGNTIMVPYDPATLQSTVQANLTKAIR